MAAWGVLLTGQVFKIVDVFTVRGTGGRILNSYLADVWRVKNKNLFLVLPDGNKMGNELFLAIGPAKVRITFCIKYYISVYLYSLLCYALSI
jgi:hypothetical protein